MKGIFLYILTKYPVYELFFYRSFEIKSMMVCMCTVCGLNGKQKRLSTEERKFLKCTENTTRYWIGDLCYIRSLTGCSLYVPGADSLG